MKLRKYLIAVLGTIIIFASGMNVNAQTTDDTLIVVFGTQDNGSSVDTEKTDAYVKETDTYYIRANHYFAMLKSVVPYFSREVSGESMYPAEYDSYITDMVRALNMEIPSGFALYASEGNTYPYQNLKPVYITVNEEYYEYGINDGEYNYVLFSSVPVGTHVDQSSFSHGGSGFFGESAIKVASFNSYREFDSLYRPATIIPIEEYDLTDKTGVFIEIPSAYISYFSDISPIFSSYKTGESDLTASKGVNVAKFSYPTPWGDNLVWYEIFLGVDDTGSVGTDTSTSQEDDLAGDRAELEGLIFILAAGVGLFFYIRHVLQKNKEEKEDYDRDMEKFNTDSVQKPADDEFDGLNVIDVEGRVIYESPENRAKREAEERASVLALPIIHKEEDDV